MTAQLETPVAERYPIWRRLGTSGFNSKIEEVYAKFDQFRVFSG